MKKMINKTVFITLLGASLFAENLQGQPIQIESYLPKLNQQELALGTGGDKNQPPISLTEPLSLVRCVKISLRNNPLTRTSQQELQSARAAVGEAKSTVFPEISLSAGYARWERHIFLPSGLAQPGMPSSVGPTDDWMAGLEARYLLFDSGQRSAAINGAKAMRHIREENVEMIRQSLILGVHQSYYGLIAARATKDITEKNLARTDDHRKLAEDRYSAGAAPQSDVIRAKVEVAGAKLNLLRANNLVRVTAGQLNQIMGLDVRTKVDVVPLENESLGLPGIDIDSAIDRALHARPEIKAALSLVEKEKTGVKLAKSNFGPTVHGRGNYGWRDESYLPEDKDWLAGVTLEMPIFSGFSKTENLKKARAELSKEEANLERLVFEVQQEVWTAFSTILETFEAVKATEAQVKDAEEGARLARDRYKVGAGTINDLLDAQTALARSEAALITARLNFRIAQATFKRAIGDLNVQDEKS